MRETSPVMSANKRVAVANARSKAIQESMLEREINDPIEVPNMDIADCQERAIAWVHSSTPKADDMRIQESLTHPWTNTPTRGHAPLKMDTPTRVHTPLKIDTPLRVHTSLERDVPLLKDTLLVEGISQS